MFTKNIIKGHGSDASFSSKFGNKDSRTYGIPKFNSYLDADEERNHNSKEEKIDLTKISPLFRRHPTNQDFGKRAYSQTPSASMFKLKQMNIENNKNEEYDIYFDEQKDI